MLFKIILTILVLFPYPSLSKIYSFENYNSIKKFFYGIDLYQKENKYFAKIWKFDKNNFYISTIKKHQFNFIDRTMHTFRYLKQLQKEKAKRKNYRIPLLRKLSFHYINKNENFKFIVNRLKRRRTLAEKKNGSYDDMA
mgnify:CR=1 FL=1